MKGTLFGVGVGPGDPELVTKKAVRVMEQADVLALPASGAGECAALSIAREAADIEDKALLFLPLPMSREEALLRESRRAAAAALCQRLGEGKMVAFLTLGDPCIYSTYLYLHRLVQRAGYPVQIVPGVPSFCAAAARLGESLCENGEMLHIVPASYGALEDALDLPGVKVLMKTGRSMERVRSALDARGLLSKTSLIENCGMTGERVVPCLENETGDGGYFSLMIVKDKEKR